MRYRVRQRDPPQMTLSLGIFWWQLAQELRCSEHYEGYYMV
jgi:hypothetical protein